MQEQREVSIFFAHQFSSELENSAEIRRAVSAAIDGCENAWNAVSKDIPVRIRYQSIPKIQSGSELFVQVMSQIEKSDICLFSLTDFNMNVIFELGFAYGRDKSSIWILNEEISQLELPSDFRSRFTLRYRDADDLANRLEGELTNRLKNILALQTPEQYFSEFWNLKSQKTGTIIAPLLPEEDRPRYAAKANPNYLKYTSFADIDATVQAIKFLNREFRMETREFVGSAWHEEISDATFFLGGPIWNERARRFYDFPDTHGDLEKIPAYFLAKDGEEFDSIIYDQKCFDRVEIDSTTSTEYAIFARITDPDKGLPVFIASGNTTHGTVVALNAFGSTEYGHKNCETVLKAANMAPQFFVLFQFRVNDGVPTVPNFSDRRTDFFCQSIEPLR